MQLSNIIELLTGIALFLFGMSLMGDGLKQVAGNRLEIILYKLTGSPVRGMLFGTGITAVIQSSSATSVMVVGFVNSGLMKLKQAIPVVLGAILGTSITGWVICLSSLEGASGWLSLLSTSTLTFLTAIVGIFFRMFSKDRFKNHLGDILLGFAVLMYGMSSMSGAVSPLKESEAFISILTTFSNPLIGILVGAGFTCILQSASAAVGILQALTVTGVISFDIALPLVMGISVGAAVPVLLSAVGATPDGQRTALAYLISNLLGVVVFALGFYGINTLVSFGFMANILSSAGVALLNTIYRLIVVVLLLPLYRQIGAITRFIIRDTGAVDEDKYELIPLEERFVANPALALEQCHNAIDDMAGRARDNLSLALGLLHNYSQDNYSKVKVQEKSVDKYEDALGTYLLKVSAHELSGKENEYLSLFLRLITDLERISDHAMNLSDSAKELAEKKITFSPSAQHDLAVVEQAVAEIAQLAITAFQNNDIPQTSRVEPLEEVIDYLCEECKFHHVDRLRAGECSFDSGFVFNDILTSYERIADHCSNIAVAMVAIESDSFDTHAYLRSVKRLKLQSFAEYFEAYSNKYHL